MLNVLDNAAKWSPPGGTDPGAARTRGSAGPSTCSTRARASRAADLPHVFERFYRADTARSLPGSGLGLAIVQQVVASHGGTVAALSPPGGGTLVHIELPTVAENEPDSPEFADLPSEPEGREEQAPDHAGRRSPFGHRTSSVLEPNPYGEPAPGARGEPVRRSSGPLVPAR